MRWEGFRKVRRQVCKRLSRRLHALDLPNLEAYRSYVASHHTEWQVLDTLCQVTISRFYRDRGVFDALRDRILPALADRARESNTPVVRCWSAGCGSGEEAYTLRILWHAMDWVDPVVLEIAATGMDRRLLERARRAVYPESSLKDLPDHLARMAFRRRGDEWRLGDGFRDGVEFIEQDIRSDVPEGRFQLVLCRNLVFTYFEEQLQTEVLANILDRLEPGGFLVIGVHESLPEGSWDLTKREDSIFEKAQ
jgi:chemotaxis protein methyltransferase CheR